MRRAFLAGLPICLTLAFWFIYPTLLMDMDSARYITNSPWRTATYPLFLDLFYGRWLLAVQLILLGASLVWLAVFSSRLLHWAVAAALVLAIGANPYLWQLQATIMSEALATPLLVILVGFLLGYAWTGRTDYALSGALICGIAASARPSLILLIIAPISLIIFTPRPDKIRLIGLSLLAWLIPLVGERLYSHIEYGPALTSPMGQNLFMKAAMVDAPPTRARSSDPYDQRLAQYLNQDFEPARRLIRQQTDPDIRNILLTYYESCASYQCVDPMLRGFKVSEPEKERRMQELSIARLRSAPLAYLNLAASEYPRMWLLHQRKDPYIARKYAAFLAKESPIPFQAELLEGGQPTPPSQQSTGAHFRRLVFAAIGILAALMTILFRVNTPLGRASWALLLGSQAVLIFSTFFGVGLVRYTMGLWPLIISGILIGVAGSIGSSPAGSGERRRS